MGEVRVSVEIENGFDREMAERGLWDPTRVRRVDVSLIVDTGSTMLALPEDIVDQLGLRRIYQTPSFLADGSPIETWVASTARLRVLGRIANVDCVVMPTGSPALLGQIPLEYLDALVDCGRRELVVNPNSPNGPSYRL